MLDNVKVIGITGEAGAGKTTVASIYADLHKAYVILTDDVAKELQLPGKACYNLIVCHFGKDILNEDDTINREKLAQIVFNDKDKLEELNELVHGEVVKEVEKRIANISHNHKYSMVILESAILFQVEALKDMCDEIWYVESRSIDRRERLKRERNYSDERITAMMNSQECIHLIKNQCNKVISNDKDIKKLHAFLSKM